MICKNYNKLVNETKKRRLTYTENKQVVTSGEGEKQRRGEEREREREGSHDII